MTIEQLIQKLKKWPKEYKVEDEHWQPVAAVHLHKAGSGKGAVWIRFKKKKRKECDQETKS